MQSKVTEADTRKSGARSPKVKGNPEKNPAINEKQQTKRQEIIATAAYYRAEKRGFKGDEMDAVQDWLEAETEIDNELDMLDVNGRDFRFLANKSE
jgi:hypothetical protein